MPPDLSRREALKLLGLTAGAAMLPALSSAALDGHPVTSPREHVDPATAGSSPPPRNASVKSVRLVLPEGPVAGLAPMAAIFSRRIEERSGAVVSTEGKGELTVELLLQPGLGAEGFMIADGKDGRIRIAGNDRRAVLYGIGKFMRTSAYGQAGFTASAWRGTSRPEKPIRGIYLATHFHNYYQTAPVEEVERYIEDLALWGINTVVVWYDIHHFAGFADPEAVAFRGRLRRFLQTARKLDLGVGFTMVANEGYGNSPAGLRAMPGAARGGDYPEEICPNKPGGLEYILRIKGEFFDWCRDLGPTYIILWPYDQGGCGTPDCQLWGANGFITCARAISRIAREKLPGVKIILSTWFFDHREWESLGGQLAVDHGWVDMIMAEDVPGFKTSDLPRLGNLPVVGFPEISMHETFPWGGFGATPLPDRLRAQWKQVQARLAGGFPYSEGIFDDINKVACTQWYWASGTPWEEILSEYIAYEFAPEAVDRVLPVIKTLEQNHHFRWWPGELDGVKLNMDWFPSKGVKPQADPGAEGAYATVRQVDAKLAPWAHKSWRWRILYIRTMLDAELKANGGNPNERAMQGFRELMKIYHTTKKTDPVVMPPIPFRDQDK